MPAAVCTASCAIWTPGACCLNIDDGYPDLSFGDGGALAIVVPVADLAAGRYDRLVTEATMG